MSASLAPECNEVKEYVSVLDSVWSSADLRRRYDSCFLKWYSESTSVLARLLDAIKTDMILRILARSRHDG